jgi:hypothetical protein
VYPMATPEATGDLNDDTSYSPTSFRSGECIFSSGNKCHGSPISKLHPPSQAKIQINDLLVIKAGLMTTKEQEGTALRHPPSSPLCSTRPESQDDSKGQPHCYKPIERGRLYSRLVNRESVKESNQTWYQKQWCRSY